MNRDQWEVGKGMRMNRFGCTAVSLMLGSGMALFAAAALAQSSVTVNVDVSKPVNVLTDQLVGTYTSMGDGDLVTDQTLGLMKSAGIKTITYPSGSDSTSQLYHWSVQRNTPKAGNADAVRNPYVNPANDFGHVAAALGRNGMTAIVHVNYGSNIGGTGGGEPKEAAAWVAYANGSATDEKEIGKDAAGEDWKTVGFWATLRGSSPLPADDGYNFLRIGRPQPLHLTLWQIGEDVPENGYYGGEHKSTFDLHAPYPALAKDNDKRRKAKELSPRFYGDRLMEYAAAMKAVDPDIKIGASIAAPTIDTWASDWNDLVLKEACKDIDFVAFGWHPGGTLPPDWKLLDDSSLFNATTDVFPKIVAEVLSEDKGDCPAGKVPRLVFSDISPATWPKVTNPMVKALFSADLYAMLGESGIANASWFQMRDDGLLDKANKPNPAYYGAQMMHIVAYKPGDAYVFAKRPSPSLAAYATRRQDGIVAVMLINQDPKQALQVKLNFAGGVAFGPSGLRFDYGPVQQSQGAAPVRSALAIDGLMTTVSVPANAIVDVLLPMKK